MVQRLSKVDAAKVLQVHHSTVDRMIQRGELQVEREGHGRGAKVWVLLDGVAEGAPGDVPEGAPMASPAGSPRSLNGQSAGPSPAPSAPPTDVSAGLSPAPSAPPTDVSAGLSPAPSAPPTDVSAEVELAAFRERVKGLEQLAEYNRQQLVDADWRYQQLLEQLTSSQRISEGLTRSLPAAALTDEPSPRRRWWPFGRSHS